MKGYTKYLALGFALLTGLFIGWIVFGYGKSKPAAAEAHVHADEAPGQVWTCSMHPQIRRDGPGKCPICGMDLIPLQTDDADEAVLTMTRTAMRLANVETTIVGYDSLRPDDVLKLNGRMEADETQSANLVSHIPGRIEKLLVSFTGEPVRAGQKIAELYSPELITAQKELLEAAKLRGINDGLLTAVRQKFKYWKIGDDFVERVLKTKQIQETFDLYADHGGVVLKKHVSVGDHLMAGQVLFEVQNLHRLWAVFDVYEPDLKRIRTGLAVRFTTSALPGRSFRGRISFVDPVIDPATRVAHIRVDVPNRSGLLKPEMFLRGEVFLPQRRRNGLVVPRTAVLWTGERSVVYVKLPDRKAPSFVLREVELGDAAGDGYVVLSGLEAGEEVVTRGAFMVDASAQLEDRPSMMNY